MKTEVHKGKNIGVIQLSRITGIDMELVGSNVPNNTLIQLTISQGSASKDAFSSERFHAEKSLIQVELTPMQYSELITSIGMGEGVPCTVSNLNGNRVEQEYKSITPQKYYAHRVKTELRDLNKAFKKNFQEAKDLLEGSKALNKKDRADILAAYHELERSLTDKLPFIQNLFVEEMEGVVSEANQQFKSNVMATIDDLGKEQAFRALTNMPPENHPTLLN